MRTTPALQSAISSFDFGGMPITSLISGPHVRDSAHFQGRAVDVGLPRNKQGWAFLVRAIESGKFSRIGTTREAVANLSEFAKQYGVQLFEDEGTGLHAHLEVAP